MGSSPKVAIIGGGAAGMMCAATLVEGSKYNIDIYEKNDQLGSKVIISGGGRCNVTTGTFKRNELLQHYTRGADFLDFTFRQFGPKKVSKRFEYHGVPLKQESDGRIFPVSDDGKDIVGVFKKLFSNHRVNLCFKESVKSINKSQSLYIVETNKGTFQYDYVVIATGGQAYRQTGSTGDGYGRAEDLGHSITQLGPSLNSFVCRESWIYHCSGISFPNANFQVDNKIISQQSGPVLLTHFGISGPQTFVLASELAFENISLESPITVKLLINTSQNYDSWETFLLNSIQDSPKKKLSTILTSKLPKRFVEGLLESQGYDRELSMSNLSKNDRKQLVNLLTNGIDLTLTCQKPGDEFVTAGGVNTDEVDDQSMESKLSPGLYFAGEILNIDGVTGGYNLQSSRATGYIAGNDIVKKRVRSCHT